MSAIKFSDSVSNIFSSLSSMVICRTLDLTFLKHNSLELVQTLELSWAAFVMIDASYKEFSSRKREKRKMIVIGETAKGG
jgi:hypothetical protein